MSLPAILCWKCSATLGPLDFSRSDHCAQCGWDTRVCKNCVHYEAGLANDCRENQADRVLEKERANFCDYFRPRPGGAGAAAGNGTGLSARDETRARAEALFKKG